jgi:hypothetical protein
MTYLYFYVAKVRWFNNDEHKTEEDYYLYAGTKLQDALEQVVADFDEDVIESVELTFIGDGCVRGIQISPSLADAFIHDCPEELQVPKTDWRVRFDKEKEDKQ